MNLATLMACATCHQALTGNLRGDSIVYRHPVTEHDHEALPVDASQVRRVFNRCHTCTGAPPVWNYRTGLIQIGALAAGAVETYNDQWHVCYRCAQFIEADDSDALTAHCAGLMHWPPHSDEYTILRTLHRGIVIGRESRTLLTTTDWPPARITADMLPKVRDRFTRLLRGAANLPAPINNPDRRRTLANQLDLVAMYWINHEFTELVNAVSSDQPPATVTDDIAPSPAGLIAWPNPVGSARHLAAVSWTPHANGWQMIGYRSIGRATDEELMPRLRHEIGWLIPIHAEDVPRGSTLDGSHPLGPLITTWLLINQQTAETVPAKLPKGTTKSYQRSQRPIPEVRIVRIKPRSPNSTPPVSQAGGTRTRAKPDHRYWVSGHERQQAYGPGRSLRRKVEIQPFLKGDEDLPIKLSTTVRVLGSRTASRKRSTEIG
ncbi:hypothetical protein F6X54_10240 [Micromonospora aurantiaca]|uniref:C2H2-type domain-containing protein n=1 Tax=Micromonospora aurantiaca (nom. illeg.) TaxID=47850 RepID=A0ABQ6UIX8_9ACTN|nr:hypothetical protein [Micromonospora aurantiaca]KAB1116852.1 hypothetical protein F6X54_10240 [Micromonospora aurantiaca]